MPSLDDFEWQLEWAIIKDTQFRDWLISAFWWQLCMRQCDQINLNITDWYPSTYFENCKYQILFHNLAFIRWGNIEYIDKTRLIILLISCMKMWKWMISFEGYDSLCCQGMSYCDVAYQYLILRGKIRNSITLICFTVAADDYSFR